MEAVPGFGERAYTDKAYKVFCDAPVERAASLEKLGWTGCTAEAVGRSLWTAAMLSIGKGKVSKDVQVLAATPAAVVPKKKAMGKKVAAPNSPLSRVKAAEAGMTDSSRTKRR